MTTEHVVAEWSTRPFTSVKRRHLDVEHRVRLVVYHDAGVDVVHEVRCDDYGPADGWATAEAYEVRPHGVEHVTSESRWWA